MAENGFTFIEREASGAPEGAFVLFHGRGADERDLFPLFDIVDPRRRLLGISVRGPLSLPPGGAHWYQVREVGYPDPATFFPTYERLAPWLDEQLAERGIAMDRTVLGGFSQGAVMTYSLGLAKGRPTPAAMLAFSGFIPRVDRFDIDLDREDLHVAIGHGIYDPVIEVQWGRDGRDRLQAAGADVFYRESPMAHSIDPRFLSEVAEWLEKVLP